jgi:putative peptidoglycan lipid II flippase
MVVYVAANQIGYLIIMMLAFREQGGYTAYAAAFILFQLPYAIFAVSIFTALLPALSSRWTASDTAGFRSMLSRGIRMTGFIVIPAACGYIAIATPIVRLVLEYGVAGEESSDLVAQTLTFFAIGLFSFAGFQLMLRAFYSMQDTRTPALINIGALGINVVVNLFTVLVLDMGVPGLALGHAAGYTFAVAIAGSLMSRRLGGLDGRRITGSLARIVVGGVLTALAALAVSSAVGSLIPGDGVASLAAQVLLSVVAGLVVFLASAYLFRMEELGLARSSLLSRFGR